MISLAEKVNEEVETNTTHVDEAVTTANGASQKATKASEEVQKAITEANTTLQEANAAKVSAQESATASAGSASAAASSASAASGSAADAAASAKAVEDIAAGMGGFDGTATSVSATDTHNLGSTNVQGQLDALAAGLDNVDMSASSVTAVDTQGIAVNAGESSTVQALIDVIADKVMTKLLEKTAIVQVESTATNKVPSSAYLKQVKDSIDSNLTDLMKSYDLLISAASTTGTTQVVNVDNYREILLCAAHSSNGTIYNAAMIPTGLFKITSASSMFRCSGGSFFAQCYNANGSITASVSVGGYCAEIYGIK